MEFEVLLKIFLIRICSVILWPNVSLLKWPPLRVSKTDRFGALAFRVDSRKVSLRNFFTVANYQLNRLKPNYLVKKRPLGRSNNEYLETYPISSFIESVIKWWISTGLHVKFEWFGFRFAFALNYVLTLFKGNLTQADVENVRSPYVLQFGLSRILPLIVKTNMSIVGKIYIHKS